MLIAVFITEMVILHKYVYLLLLLLLLYLAFRKKNPRLWERQITYRKQVKYLSKVSECLG